MPDTTGDDKGDGSYPSSASETIAALWAEREEQHQALRPSPPPPPAPKARPKRDPAPDGSGGSRGFGVGTAAAVVAGALVLSAAAGFFVVGRGGGPSRAAFVAKADGVCRPADAMLSISRPSSYPELATAAATFATAAEGELAQLRQVSRPGGGAGAEASTVVNDLAVTTAAARSLHDAAAQKDDGATVAAVTKLSSASADATGAAGAYGMTACGSGLQPHVQTLFQGAGSVIKAGFTAKADVLCRAASDDFDAIPEPRADTQQEVLRFLDAAVTVQAAAGDQLRALPTPPGDEATVTEMLTAFDQVTAKARSMRDSVALDDESGFVVASREITTLGTTADAKFDAYGLGVCGSNFGNI